MRPMPDYMKPKRRTPVKKRVITRRVSVTQPTLKSKISVAGPMWQVTDWVVNRTTMRQRVTIVNTQTGQRKTVSLPPSSVAGPYWTATNWMINRTTGQQRITLVNNVTGERRTVSLPPPPGWKSRSPTRPYG